jgi:hypothetical protein
MQRWQEQALPKGSGQQEGGWMLQPACQAGSARELLMLPALRWVDWGTLPMLVLSAGTLVVVAATASAEGARHRDQAPCCV